MKNLFHLLSDKAETIRKEDTPEDANRNAATAVCALLLEMAGIDGEFSEAEKGRVISILKNQFHLNDAEAEQIAELAHRELDGSLDLWTFTNRINQNYSTEEKLKLVELLWQVIYADKKLDRHEDYLIHKLARLLNLTHRQLIEAKLKVLHPDG